MAMRTRITWSEPRQPLGSMTVRECRGCRVIQPVEEFTPRRGTRLTLHCRRCRSLAEELGAEGADQQAARKAQYRRDHPWETWAASCIHTKRTAGIVVTLTAADLLAVVKKQNFRCALTGLPFWTATKKSGSVSWDSPSVDRIHHGGAYSLRNVRIVLHCVNTFRGRMRDDQMMLVVRALIGKADGYRPGPKIVYLKDFKK